MGGKKGKLPGGGKALIKVLKERKEGWVILVEAKFFRKETISKVCIKDQNRNPTTTGRGKTAAIRIGCKPYNVGGEGKVVVGESPGRDNPEQRWEKVGGNMINKTHRHIRWSDHRLTRKNLIEHT